MAQIDAIDTKANNLFLIASVALPITASLLGAGDLNIRDYTVAKIAIFGSFAAYAACFVFFYLSYRLAGWSRRPNLDALRDHAEGHSDDEVARYVADMSIKSYYQNRGKITKKASRVGWLSVFLAVEVVLLGVAVLVPLLSEPASAPLRP